MLKKLIIILIYCFCIVSLAFPNSTDNSYVEDLIKSKTDEAVSLINNKKYNEKEKKDKIFEIVSPLFDFHTMAKLTLGKKYWPKLTAEQKKKFTELFKKRIKMVYLDRVSIVGNLEVTYKPSTNKGKRIIYVPAIFKTKDKNYSVLFKLWKSKQGWKIYDVEVEGISVIRTYKSQFYDILSKGSIDDLLKKLENTTAPTNATK